MDLPLLALLLLAALAHVGVLLVVWSLLLRTVGGVRRAPQAARTPRWRTLAVRIGAGVAVISVIESGVGLLVDGVSRGKVTGLVGGDPLRAGIVFAATYATLIAWAIFAGHARESGGSVSMAVGAGMAVAIFALTVSTLPWIDVEPSCGVGTFFFHEPKAC